MPTIDFDESEEYLIYPSMIGIVFYSISSRKCERVLGKTENERFIKCLLYQGKVMRNPAGSSSLQGERKAADPILMATSFRRQRFYLFSRRAPENEGNSLRDVINERITREEAPLMANAKTAELSNNQVVLQTTHGDIHLLLYTEDCPKTCENFTKLVKKGYYNGMIFHRVIRGFMNQTGCPNGDGTGGESIWGVPFEDQIMVHKHRFEKPYLVAMANRGPNTNTSQFFLTVVACPWLDGKHTIFGRIVKGIETVIQTNKIKTDKTDKPLTTIKIISAKIA